MCFWVLSIGSTERWNTSTRTALNLVSVHPQVKPLHPSTLYGCGWVLKCRYSYFTFLNKKRYWWIPWSMRHRTLSPAEIRRKKKIQTTFYLFTTVADRPAKSFPRNPKTELCAVKHIFYCPLCFFSPPLLKWRKWKIGEKKKTQATPTGTVWAADTVTWSTLNMWVFLCETGCCISRCWQLAEGRQPTAAIYPLCVCVFFYPRPCKLEAIVGS